MYSTLTSVSDAGVGASPAAATALPSLQAARRISHSLS